MCTARPRAARFALTQLADQIEVTGQLLPLWFCFDSRGRLMATITYVSTINRVAKKLGEYPELLQASATTTTSTAVSSGRRKEQQLEAFVIHPFRQRRAQPSKTGAPQITSTMLLGSVANRAFGHNGTLSRR